MSGTLSRSDLRADHKAALGSVDNKFKSANNADYDRHLNNAALALSRLRRRTLVGELTLVSDQSSYPAPADLVAVKVSTWGQNKLQPWDVGYCRLPRMSVFEGTTGLMINLAPAPTASQIGLFGSKYSYFYLAAHQLDDDATKTTFKAADRDLFLLLALIEAMTELASMGVTEPIQLHRGMGSVPANTTPAALVELLTKLVDQRR